MDEDIDEVDAFDVMELIASLADATGVDPGEASERVHAIVELAKIEKYDEDWSGYSITHKDAIRIEAIFLIIVHQYEGIDGNDDNHTWKAKG